MAAARPRTRRAETMMARPVRMRPAEIGGRGTGRPDRVTPDDRPDEWLYGTALGGSTP
jgi:hypothetical protein